MLLSNPSTANDDQNTRRRKAATMVIPPRDADIGPSLTPPGSP